MDFGTMCGACCKPYKICLGENACFHCRPKWASVHVIITINIWSNVELCLSAKCIRRAIKALVIVCFKNDGYF